MSDSVLICPRRSEGGAASVFPGNDAWQDRNDHAFSSCNYCGSLHPDSFMELVRAGVKIIPTDKNYKAYIMVPTRHPGKMMVKGWSNKETSDDQRWTQVTDAVKAEYPNVNDAKFVWITPEPETTQAKFYYQHLSVEQRKEFVQLYNDKVMQVDRPGHFYVPPFFMRFASSAE